MKLPLWTVGWVLDQSATKYPQVITGAEIKRCLNISEDAALRLKKRVQVFASQHKSAVESLFYSELKKRFHKSKDLLEPDRSDINKRVTTPVGNKPIPQSDSVVLFSAKERSNKGRKRFRHHGQTASIYLTDSLGGRQVGVMVQTTTWKGGPALYESIPNQQTKTILPIIQRQIPKNTPFFTDMGMDWLKPYNRNHRTVNHNLQSKRGTGKSRRRFQQNGIHTQAAEGRQGALKTAFRAYRYIKPEHSQLYLNEYSFFGALKYYGAERITAQNQSLLGNNLDRSTKQAGWGLSGMNVGQKAETITALTQPFFYRPPTMDDRRELSPRAQAFRENREIMEAIGSSNEKLANALTEYQKFYAAPTVSHQRRRERQYAHTAQKLWQALPDNGYADLSLICRENGLSKRMCHRVVARWSHIGLTNVIDRTVISRNNKEHVYDVQRILPNLPHVLYMVTGPARRTTLKEWQSHIKSDYPRAKINNTLRGRKYERRWLQTS
ncbi:transposase [Turneriella parva]|uniref:transposase n=1 Tax=Turneriella parva TaxID=29510 RepID=UPI0012F6DA10|nr:transposase [Turneriella parva]